jgi:hypothetical protein
MVYQHSLSGGKQFEKITFGLTQLETNNSFVNR